MAAKRTDEGERAFQDEVVAGHWLSVLLGALIETMGEPDKANLRSALEHAGWSVKRHSGDEWWIHESWELASVWRPLGAKIYVTLLVDPQSATSDVSSVWAIAASTTRPTDRTEADRSAIRVSPDWPERMKEIIAAASLLRAAS